MNRYVWIALVCFFTGFNTPAFCQSWDDIVENASGQTIYFNAWGGSQPINDYIKWASDQVKKDYGVQVNHVKVTDISEVVSRILVEKSANRHTKGSVDLMWINGENFKAMKENRLLFGPFSHLLPNYALVDTENKKNLLFDFTVPVDHMESPWGMAQLVFMYDTRQVVAPPESMKELLDFARSNPGRFTYPAIPEFHGTTFIKQALIELIDDPDVLNRPVAESDFEAVTRPLWQFLDQLQPYLWRKGTTYPAGASQMLNLLNDTEIFISLSFNPNSASNAIENGELPDTVRTYVHSGGTIGNAHFLGIPFNSSAKEAAMVFANFLLSPNAQARKSDPKIWGDPTVLDINQLQASQKKLFDAVPKGIATLTPEQLGKTLPEPHSSWVRALEKEWLRRYSK